MLMKRAIVLLLITIITLTCISFADENYDRSRLISDAVKYNEIVINLNESKLEIEKAIIQLKPIIDFYETYQLSGETNRKLLSYKTEIINLNSSLYDIENRIKNANYNFDENIDILLFNYFNLKDNLQELDKYKYIASMSYENGNDSYRMGTLSYNEYLDLIHTNLSLDMQYEIIENNILIIEEQIKLLTGKNYDDYIILEDSLNFRYDSLVKNLDYYIEKARNTNITLLGAQKNMQSKKEIYDLNILFNMSEDILNSAFEDYNLAVLTYKDTLSNVLFKVNENYYDLENKIEIMKLNELKSVEVTKEFDLAKFRYDHGLLSRIEFLKSDYNLCVVQNNYSRSVRDVTQALYKLEKSTIIY